MTSHFKRNGTGAIVRIAGLVFLGLAIADGSAAHQSSEPKTSDETGASESGGHMMGDGQGEMMGETEGHMPGMRLMMPDFDAARGRKLFASKGCVACHAINGVGGHDATALDAHTMTWSMNPFEFAAKMWRMAPAMIYAQEEALGEQIFFTGDELADIIAFVHNDEEQHRFSEADIPPEIREMMHHTHGEPGAGAKAHEEELGHQHGMDEEDDEHHED